jgi:DEAD/DEAH box helicase domain-containing protein
MYGRLWQQAGRAGRGEEESLAVLLTSASPIDQFLARNPDYFFSRSVESALINPDNLLILLAHLRCATFELPFRKNERFGSVEADLHQEFLGLLLQDGTIYQSGEKFFWMADAYPAQEISLRSASTERVVLQVPRDGYELTIGEVDKPSANWMVHPGAIYLHEAQTYHVDELDLHRLVAYLHPIFGDYYTEPRSETNVQLVEQFGGDEVHGGYKAYGEILVTTQVIGFRKVRWHTHENLGYGDLDLPPSELLTTGYWVALSDSTIQGLQNEGMWNNARNYYGPNWQQIRINVRERDGFRCQVCGVIEGERAHDVHHKVPLRMFPSPELANQLSNLITLCPSCHQRAELAVRVRSGLAGLAFALENLAPLYLMCDSRDLGVYSDPQSNFADGGPAILIYDQIPAGIGFSERLFEIHYDLVSNTRDLVATCECMDGCPSCVGPGGEFGQGGKREALAILDTLAKS